MTGRLGLLATPMVAAALALTLSACGSPAPGPSTPGSGSPAASGSPAVSGTSTASDASATAFCGTWLDFRTTLSQLKPILDAIPAPSPSAAPASLLLPTLQSINSVFSRLEQVAPPAVSADMADLANYWSQIVADFQNGTTVAQAEAYIHAHPPTDSATINASTQRLADYLSTTCHIDMSS